MTGGKVTEQRKKVTEQRKGFYEIYITGHAHDGAGVGRIAGQVIFVPGALEGEKVLVAIEGARKGVLRGMLKEVLIPSEARIVPICSVYAQCGGCHLQHVAYAAQLQIKEEIVRDTLQRLGGIKDASVQPVLGMANPWGYRNKGHFQVGFRKNKVHLGFFAEGSHCLAWESCRHLFSSGVSSLLTALEDILTSFQVRVADEGTAGLRCVLIRESRAYGEMLVVLIYSGEYSQRVEDIAREIMQRCSAVVGVCQSKNTRVGGAVLGRKSEVILGRDWIEDKIGQNTFRISPASFFQINSVQTNVLYKKVLEYAALSGEEEVVDAYCGIGTISLFLAQQAKKVMGMEIMPEAVADAKKNAEHNGVSNVEFIKGKAEELMPEMVHKGAKPEVVVVDPPRRGCDRALLDSIIAVAPQRVVYVSCNPATLARDLRHLVEGGYAVREVQPVDMFPQTSHVECVTLMSKVEK